MEIILEGTMEQMKTLIPLIEDMDVHIKGTSDELVNFMHETKGIWCERKLFKASVTGDGSNNDARGLTFNRHNSDSLY